MRLAILGATSHIAKDMIVLFSAQTTHELILFGRYPRVTEEWLASVDLFNQYGVADFEEFRVDEHFDAILNFVGVGNPAKAMEMGTSIFDVTLKYDEMALNYLRYHPDCRYVFLSSGAAYGSIFERPADCSSQAVIAINNLEPQSWYAVAKLHAECHHRALQHLSVVDIRLFNYFSHTQDVSERFLITDILRAILHGETLITSSDNIIRDYIGPDDLFQLVSLVFDAPPTNDVVDCYTRAPVDKMTLLNSMHKHFGLRYEVSRDPAGVNATGVKMNYYSKNRRAQVFGYVPRNSALSNVLDQAHLLINRHDQQ